MGLVIVQKVKYCFACLDKSYSDLALFSSHSFCEPAQEETEMKTEPWNK